MSETPEEQDTFEKVETFIRRMHNLEYTFDPKNIDKMLKEVKVLTGKDEATFGECLSKAINLYETYKNDPERKKFYAGVCLAWITNAFVEGVIREGQGAFAKLEYCEQLNEQLKEELEKWKNKCEELELLLKAIKSDFIGGVEP